MQLPSERFSRAGVISKGKDLTNEPRCVSMPLSRPAAGRLEAAGSLQPQFKRPTDTRIFTTMKLATFRFRNQLPRLGVLLDTRIADLNAAYRAMLDKRGALRSAEMADALVPPCVVGFLEGGARSAAAGHEALEFVKQMGPEQALSRSLAYPAADVRLMAPVPKPRKFLLVGLNYRDHAQETGAKLPEHPSMFTKLPDCIIGPGEPIRVPKVSYKIDYEGEFAFVMGRRCYAVSSENALEYVAGYTIVNDVSCRDYQRHTSQWTMGKNFDTCGPMGPYLVLKEEVSDPSGLDISLSLNGEVMQHSNTRNLIFGVPQLVEYISSLLTLEPGDVISTGTPSGVGFVRKPPVFLKAGDRVRIEVEKVGVLENPVEGP